MKKLMYILISIALASLFSGLFILRTDTFGARPNGERLKLIKQSKNFRDGKFQNQSPTPSLAEGYSYLGVMYDFLLRKKESLTPKDSIPSVKTDLKSLPAEADLLVWFGHSSYLMRLNGKTILVDPVLSNFAAPFSWMNKAFKGTDIYNPEDLPQIDYLLITHDHYDHLDYHTIRAIKDKVGKVICGLGVGAHFEKWGYPVTQLIEKDWGDKVVLNQDLTLHFMPARHFSGRSIYSNNTLWSSYVIETKSKKIFVGGDSGYDKHFTAIGAQFGGFDLAILENGQYNEAWRYIHTLPEEVLKVSQDLKAKRTFPVHSSKFNLGGHAWNEPLIKITELNQRYQQNLITPMIGQVVELDNPNQVFGKWWEQVK